MGIGKKQEKKQPKHMVNQEQLDMFTEAAKVADTISKRRDVQNDPSQDDSLFAWSQDGMRAIRCSDCDQVSIHSDWRVAFRSIATHYLINHKKEVPNV